MSKRKSPEFTQLMGYREADDDGFTYRYGKHRNGYTKKPRHNNSIDLMVRHDKRAVKGKELKRLRKEEGF